jgi:6-phosphogluconolactonase
MTTHTFPDLGALSTSAAEYFVSQANEAIGRKGLFQVALAGGNTPRGLYELLAAAPYRDQIDWAKVWVFWSDERWVPPSDPNSNEGMARAALLDHVPVPAYQVFPMYREGSVSDGAEAYEATIKGRLPFDLTLLGMGDDGHTASLFPGIAELDEQHRLVVPTTSPKGVPQRISLTLPAFQRIGPLLFLVAGADKAEPLARAFGESDALRPPSGAVARAARRALWYIDAAAAADL